MTLPRGSSVNLVGLARDAGSPTQAREGRQHTCSHPERHRRDATASDGDPAGSRDSFAVQ